jgi:hypothetical protein
MKNYLLIFLMALFACFEVKAQTNVVYGNAGDYTFTPQTNVSVTVTLLAPNPRVLNGTNILADPIKRITDTSGYYSFTNLPWGKYRVDFGGVGTSQIFYVGTNSTGLVNLTTLITNASAIPPYGYTNYVTQIINQFSNAPTAASNNIVITNVAGTNFISAQLLADPNQFGTNSGKFQITNGATVTNIFASGATVSGALLASNIVVTGPATNLPAVFVNNTLTNSASGTNGQVVIFNAATPGGILGVTVPTNVVAGTGLSGVTNGQTVTLTNTVPFTAASNNITITNIGGTNYISTSGLGSASNIVASTGLTGTTNGAVVILSNTVPFQAASNNIAITNVGGTNYISASLLSDSTQFGTNAGKFQITNGALVTNLFISGAGEQSCRFWADNK